MNPVPTVMVGGNERRERLEPDRYKEVKMDLYLEFRKMVRPLIIENTNGETVEAEDYSSLNMPDEKEEVEEAHSALAFAG